MNQNWCAICSFPELKKFIFGTVTLDARAPHHEVEAAMLCALLDVFPIGITIHELIPGSLVFKEENHEEQ